MEPLFYSQPSAIEKIDTLHQLRITSRFRILITLNQHHYLFIFTQHIRVQYYFQNLTKLATYQRSLSAFLLFLLITPMVIRAGHFLIVDEDTYDIIHTDHGTTLEESHHHCLICSSEFLPILNDVQTSQPVSLVVLFDMDSMPLTETFNNGSFSLFQLRAPPALV